ncbi:MAG: hypothetical protein WDN28_06000 [Chthoniobacter sp.]
MRGKFITLKSRLKMIQDFISFFHKEYDKKEPAFWQVASIPANVPQDDPLLKKRYDDFFEKDVSVLDGMIGVAEHEQVFEEGNTSLLNAYQRIRGDWNKQSVTLIAAIDDLIKELAFAETKTSAPSPLLKEIRERLEAIKIEIQPAAFRNCRKMNSSGSTRPT